MERRYNGKMITKQILRAQEHSRIDVLEREETETSEQRLTFNITYYPVFQNIRNILQEMHLLLALDKKHKKVFPNVLVAGLCIGNSLSQTSPTLPKTNEIER